MPEAISIARWPFLSGMVGVKATSLSIGMNQVLPGACLAHARPAAGFHQVVGRPVQPAKSDRPAAGALQRGGQQRIDWLGSKVQTAANLLSASVLDGLDSSLVGTL
jgi:hypothetical protein